MQELGSPSYLMGRFGINSTQGGPGGQDILSSGKKTQNVDSASKELNERKTKDLNDNLETKKKGRNFIYVWHWWMDREDKNKKYH